VLWKKEGNAVAVVLEKWSEYSERPKDLGGKLSGAKVFWPHKKKLPGIFMIIGTFLYYRLF
jgi:hypothetical protein